jgi:uncharacterized protein (TIGR03118 family)
MSHLSTSAKVIAVAASLIGSPALGAVPLTDAQLDRLTAGILFNIADEVSNQPNVAPVTDTALVNPWGMSASPGGNLWVANNGSNTSTTFAAGTFGLARTVNVPGAPTGATFIGPSNGFDISAGGNTAGSRFAFATESGQILGWNAKVDPNNAVVAVDQSAKHAVFMGLTFGMNGQNPLLFAADFAHGVVKSFDSNFAKVGRFTDPALPANYSPFNVQVLNNELYVAYAERNRGSGAEVAGHGLGIVDVFDTQGNLLRRLIPDGGKLNAPWGLAIAPQSFGEFAGALLVGNFGNGKIDAYNPQTGQFLGQIQNANGNTAVIGGLWTLLPGPNGSVLFSAGDATHGLVGAISPVAMPTTSAPTPSPTPSPPIPSPMPPTPTTAPPMPVTPVYGYDVLSPAAMMHP